MGFKLETLPLICMTLFLALLASRASARPIEQNPSLLERHEQWMARHGRIYKDEAEKATRFEIFKGNLKRIEDFNKHNTYTLGVNQFSDLTEDEFKATHTNYYTASSSLVSSFEPTSSPTPSPIGNNTFVSDDVPDSLDWRERGAVTDVKNQDQCGCCWAFSAVGAIEGRYQISTGQLISLSEQELVDCTPRGSTYGGCHGNYMDSAFNFVQQNGGVATESSYPYTATDTNGCQPQAFSNAASISGHQDVAKNDEGALLQAVVQGPVSIGIDGTEFAFMHYNSGVFSGPCGSTITHAVTLVGYGTADDGTEFWLLKNSWGTNWGEEGYMRILRNSGVDGGMCGLTLMASYPVI